MPWKESHRVNERMKFIGRLEAGERMTDLCREFEISRKTGYKILERYQRLGPLGLYDQSTKPLFNPRKTPDEIRDLVILAKKDHLTWGSRKIKEWLKKKHPDLRIPAPSVIHTILDRQGLVKHKRYRRTCRTGGTEERADTSAPNEVWCADFKGQFKMGNAKYCYPLTVTDHRSRYILGCEALENVRTEGAMRVFEQIFMEFGLPDAILSDNGPPFGTPGLFGLGQLSIWWLRLGIQIQRIKPGHPEQNGRHERMHLTLKQSTTRPPGKNLLQQQERFNEFKTQFNEQRPHEALNMKCPADLYRPSQKAYPKQILEPIYPFHDLVRRATQDGRVDLCQRRRFRFYLGKAFGGQRIAFKEEEPGLWRTSFLNFDLGLYDESSREFTPFERLQPSGANQ